MEALFECLGKEFGDVGFTSMNINPSHTVNYTKNGKLENIIITPVKKLDNVSVENLESAYLLAKPDIIKEIYNDYGKKYLNISDKLEKLNAFIELSNNQEQAQNE